MARGDHQLGEPLLAVLPDLRAPVRSHGEEGLQGVAVNPGFKTNGAIHPYCAPKPDTSPRGDAPMDGSAGGFRKATQQWTQPA